MASIAFPAWCLGHDPSAQILCVSYAQDLADKLARDCRSIMLRPWYQRMFATRLAPHRQAVAEFLTTAQGYRLSTSNGGVLTGKGADMILIDDPLKPEEALSDVQRRATNDWFDNTLYSRLNDKRHGAIVIIMQRLHEDDLVGHVLAQEDWEIVSFPAIAEADEVHPIETIWGPQRFTRRRGEALHPQREPLDTLERLRRTLGEYNFAGQYQQSPAPLGGGLVKEEWFRRYAEDQLPDSFDRIVQSWDTANKVSELADFSVCTTWGVKGKQLYLLSVLRRKLEYPALKRAVREQQSLFNASVVLIEDKASGTQLIQELIVDGCHAVTRYKPECDKIMRLHAQTAVIENGFVHLPQTAPWLADGAQLVTLTDARDAYRRRSACFASSSTNQRPLIAEILRISAYNRGQTSGCCHGGRLLDVVRSIGAPFIFNSMENAVESWPEPATDRYSDQDQDEQGDPEWQTRLIRGRDGRHGQSSPTPSRRYVMPLNGLAACGLMRFAIAPCCVHNRLGPRALCHTIGVEKTISARRHGFSMPKSRCRQRLPRKRCRLLQEITVTTRS